MKHKILCITAFLCAMFFTACSDLVYELTPNGSNPNEMNSDPATAESVTLKTGSTINAILITDLRASSATQFKKSGTNNDSTTLYIDEDNKIPVWYDSTDKIIYYYVPNGCTIEMNPDSASMFHALWDLTSLDISGWNTSNVTDMSSMFRYCQNLGNL